MKRGLADPQLAADVRRFIPAFVLLQRGDDLLFGVSFFGMSTLLFPFSEGLNRLPPVSLVTAFAVWVSVVNQALRQDDQERKISVLSPRSNNKTPRVFRIGPRPCPLYSGVGVHRACLNVLPLGD